MSEEIHFVRAKTLSMKTTHSSSNDVVLKRVMRHNLREIQSEFGDRANSTVDPRRIHLNEILFGLNTADGVADAAHDAMTAAGVRQRANAALGIEVVFSLPRGLTIDYRAYFLDSIQWAKKYFDVPMLSATVHNDEDYPHMHIVMLPMRDGELIGRNLLGGKPKTIAMHKNFNVEVGKRYGLKTPTPAKRHSAEWLHLVMQMAREYMRDVSGFTDATVDALVKVLAKDPEATMTALGLPMPTEPGETVAGIFTRDCGRESAIALPDVEHASAIALCGAEKSGQDCGQKQKRYALIALSISPPSFPPPNEPTSASKEATMTSAATFIEQATEIEPTPPQAAIIESLATVTASPELAPLPTVITDTAIQPATRTEPSTAPAPHSIEPRQPGLFDQFDTPASTSSNQPAHDPHVVPEAAATGKREYRVSDERRDIVRAILLDPERAGLGDRAISRETSVSAAIIRAMRRSIAPAAGKVRTFERGGKTYTMDAANIGKRPAAQQTAASGPEL